MEKIHSLSAQNVHEPEQAVVGWSEQQVHQLREQRGGELSMDTEVEAVKNRTVQMHPVGIL